MLAATPLKEFNTDFAGRRTRCGVASGSTAFQWSSKAVPHPAGGQVLVSLSSAQLYTSAGQDSPPGVVFSSQVEDFVSAARGPSSRVMVCE
jgi:hypothetical protein